MFCEGNFVLIFIWLTLAMFGVKSPALALKTRYLFFGCFSLFLAETGLFEKLRFFKQINKKLLFLLF
jgi:hypothetical protein